MIRPLQRASVLVGSLILLLSISGPAVAGAAPVTLTPPIGAPAPETITDGCPYQTTPVPPVDESEVVPVGMPSPTPLPVPDPPVGGDLLGGCGVVLAPGAAPAPEGLTAAGWLIADLTADKVLAAKDPHGRYRPASTIKVLLALVVLDELDLDATITGTQDDDEVEGDAAGVGPGGIYTVRDLLAGLMLVSGNDCAHALARELGGQDAAVEKMNEKAAELGATDTRAASASGLDGPGMSSSPYDEALIFRAALQFPEFVEISRHDELRFPGYPGMPTDTTDADGNESSAETTAETTPSGDPGIDLYNMNQLLYSYPGMIAGKTGYTDDARKTFVGAAERDGRQILIVQMYGLNDGPGSYWRQAEAMLDYGFAQPAAQNIGTLIEEPGQTTESAGAEPRDGNRVAAPESEAGTDWTVRLFIGLLGALVVVGLVYAGLRMDKRH
ncbi:D-alanyl-D-alanine carboxypeptidase family protein [Williamsia soli]|uniref:D-alanyl-D-alanine carboxypeptidase family protein n=1 Tax=Williamsia soli TaxID=364929 RepID=UPI001A9D90C8|nr:D-alanyl-D-alanine carboxypeptidase family protein [Williamsia soli]